MSVVAIQTTKTPHPDRTDHVWHFYPDDCVEGTEAHWKCVLCGAITTRTPPGLPTPGTWFPERYERLTPQERSLCPEQRSH